jgi:hypothetical protein
MTTHVDGNAIAGMLMEIFAVDMTDSHGECATCGDVAPLADTRVYLQAPGVVVRCRSCGSVLATIVDEDGHRRINLQGLTWLDVAH